MTGWRLGWLIVPDEPVEALDNLQANLALCPPAAASTLSDHTDDSELWVRELLNATGVALAPSVDFGPVDGHRFVRLSFCGEYEEILQACERLRTLMP